MPPNDPTAYRVPGNPSSGLRDRPGNTGHNPGNPTTVPGVPSAPSAPPTIRRTGNTLLAGGGDLEQEVIANYMTLDPGQKKILLAAMTGELGEILKIVLPDQLEAVIQEAIDTPSGRIGLGNTPPQTGAQSVTSRSVTPGPAPPPADPGSLGSSAIPRGANVLSGFR